VSGISGGLAAALLGAVFGFGLLLVGRTLRPRRPDLTELVRSVSVTGPISTGAPARRATPLSRLPTVLGGRGDDLDTKLRGSGRAGMGDGV